MFWGDPPTCLQTKTKIIPYYASHSLPSKFFIVKLASSYVHLWKKRIDSSALHRIPLSSSYTLSRNTTPTYIMARHVTTLPAFSLSSASLIHRSLLISTPFAFNDVIAEVKKLNQRAY